MSWYGSRGIDIEVDFVSQTECRVNIIHGKKVGSERIGALPGSRYDKGEKRWYVPIMCLPDLEEIADTIEVEPAVGRAYQTLVRRMMSHMRAAGVVFCFEDDSPVIHYGAFEGQMREHITGMIKKNSYAVMCILYSWRDRKWERENALHRHNTPGDRAVAPAVHGRLESNGVGSRGRAAAARTDRAAVA